jgi:Tol biopolymer transport system component
MEMRRIVLLLASMALLAVLVVSGVMLVLKEPAQAAFPGQNGKIAFHSLRVGFDTWYEIYTMNTDGSSTTRLTDNAVQDISASWSPDGTKIVFTRGLGADTEIYTMNADGSDLQQLTNNSYSDQWPSWSPDRTDKIAFASRASGTDWQIYVMNVDGSDTRQLTNMVATPCTTGTDAPDWSPDGTKIAFQAQIECSNPDIFVMNADGSRLTNLTQNLLAEYDPAWSPDGTKIAYYAGGCRSDGTQDFEIYTMNADGSGQTNVTNSPGACDIQPAWQPRPLDPLQEPMTKQQCKDGGWRDFGFPNQRQCIKAVKQAS